MATLGISAIVHWKLEAISKPFLAVDLVHTPQAFTLAWERQNNVDSQTENHSQTLVPTYGEGQRTKMYMSTRKRKANGQEQTEGTLEQHHDYLGSRRAKKDLEKTRQKGKREKSDGK